MVNDIVFSQRTEEKGKHRKVTSPSIDRLTFLGDNAFQAELRRRVNEYFRQTGTARRDSRQLYLKAGIILLAFVSGYSSLVFLAETWWQAVPLSVLLGLITVGIGFNLMHDGGHEAFSRHRFINKLMACSLDIVGGSSYFWHWKHRVIHHTYSNVTGHDTDIALGALARFTPHQPRYRHQRWQHWYVWPLYGVMAIKWHFYDDFRTLLMGRIGPHRIPRPRNWDLAVFIGCKLAFFSLAFGIPLLIHSFWTVVLCYGVFAIVLGMVLSVVFQLAHCVEDADFPMPAEGTTSIENAWAVHQVQTTVDFCRHNRVVTWLLGGLNFQIEHHLFPRVCHSNYPAISSLVKATCRDYGIRYKEHRSFWSGMLSHYRWMRKMGEPALQG